MSDELITRNKTETVGRELQLIYMTCYLRAFAPKSICHVRHQRLLTSGISRGTLRTCMPCKTTGLGWSIVRTGAPSWTSVEVKLED